MRSKPDKEYARYIIVATIGYTIPLSEAEMENSDRAVARYLMKCCVITADGMHVLHASPNPVIGGVTG